MSLQLGELCSVILQQHFGEIVKIVGENLYTSSKSLISIIKTTNLSKDQVTNALSILIKFGLVNYELMSNKSTIEYFIQTEPILYILRYPRYINLVQSKYGQIATFLTEEFLYSGSNTATTIILKSILKSVNTKNSLPEFRDKFINMVQLNYFIRAPVVTTSLDTKNPILKVDSENLFIVPEINLIELIKMFEEKKTFSKSDDIFWKINFDRFHQEFRDIIMLSAIERHIDENASECFKYILQLMYIRTDAWQTVSNPVPFVEIKQMCDKNSINANLIKFLDQYVTILNDDSLNFLTKYGDSGGGMYTVQMKKAIEQLVWWYIENFIAEKFGLKACRIFRVIKLRNYIEQEDIQKEAMIPSKEAKQITYKLLEEHFLQIQTIRKAGGGGSGPAKAFYLFYVNQTQIVTMLLENCYKAVFNTITRTAEDKHTNKRLIEKSRRLDSIVESMKERGESEEYITEMLETLTPPERNILEKHKNRIKSLYSAEIGLEESIFLLKLYQYYRNAKS